MFGRLRLRRCDDDDSPPDAMPTIQDSSPEFLAASASACGDDDDDPLGTLYRNLAGCVMGVRPEAKRYPQHQEPSLADGLSFALRRSPCSKPCSTAPCDDYRRFGAHCNLNLRAITMKVLGKSSSLSFVETYDFIRSLKFLLGKLWFLDTTVCR